MGKRGASAKKDKEPAAKRGKSAAGEEDGDGGAAGPSSAPPPPHTRAEFLAVYEQLAGELVADVQSDGHPPDAVRRRRSSPHARGGRALRAPL